MFVERFARYEQLLAFFFILTAQALDAETFPLRRDSDKKCTLSDVVAMDRCLTHHI